MTYSRLKPLSQSEVVLAALLDEVQKLRDEMSRVWGKMNSLQTKVLEIDARQREIAERLGGGASNASE